MKHPLQDALAAIVGADGILLDDAVRARHTNAIRSEPLKARLLVRPRGTSQVAAVLAACHGVRCPVVTHGGLTGLVHGCDADGDDVIVSLERMNAIEEISPAQRVAVVQAGVTLQQLQEAAEAAGLFFPLDLGARGSATIGGMVSTNAGGNRVIRYGMMRELVLGLEAVLADGTVLSSLNRVLKNNTGYDLKQLFIGAEGTLGVVTRVVVRLRERPISHDVALIAVPGFAQVGGLLKHMDGVLGGSLSAFEVMWREFHELVTTPPARGRAALPREHPFYVLVESLGGQIEQDTARFETALGEAMEVGLIADAALARSDRERAAFWALRDDVAQMGRDGPAIAYDVSLPFEATERYVSAVKVAVMNRWPQGRCWAYGHLGDGNVHLVMSVGAADASTHSAMDAIVYPPLAELGGAVSAEHGIGLEKKEWLSVSRSEVEISLMRALKSTLDPRGILNPGNLF